MAGSAGHEQEYDVLSFRGEVGSRRRGERGRLRGRAGAGQELVQRDRPEADAAFLQEPTASELAGGRGAVEIELTVHD